MGISEELYLIMLEVGHIAGCHKIPGPLTSLVGAAQRMLDLWRQDEKAAMRFASRVLSGPTDLRKATAHLPEPAAAACWRLIQLLEYLSNGSKAEVIEGPNSRD